MSLFVRLPDRRAHGPGRAQPTPPPDRRDRQLTYPRQLERAHACPAGLVFNDRDELVDFWSDDRPDSSTGAFLPMRWSTPVSEYRDLDGRHILHRGGAVYHRPNGPFTYGEFTLSSIQYDLAGPHAD